MIYLASSSVGMKQCCSAKKNAGAIIAAYLFLIKPAPHPRYSASSASAVVTGRTMRFITASTGWIGAIMAGGVYMNLP